MLTSAAIITSVSSETPRTTVTPPLPNRIVAACGSAVERNATLPLTRPIAAASFGVRAARRNVAARISTIGTGSGSTSMRAGSVMGAEATFVAAWRSRRALSPHSANCSHVIATSLTNCHVSRPRLPGRRTSTRSGRKLRAAPLASWMVMLPSAGDARHLAGQPSAALDLAEAHRLATGQAKCEPALSVIGHVLGQPPMIRACSLRMPASHRS